MTPAINGMVVTMAHRSLSAFSAGVLALVFATGAHAQGTQQVMPGSAPGAGTGGGGVTTGAGPLSQPVAPATGRWQQNTQPQNIQRPGGVVGPAQTNPGQNPFGGGVSR
jgi:hypothetical protein